ADTQCAKGITTPTIGLSARSDGAREPRARANGHPSGKRALFDAELHGQGTVVKKRDELSCINVFQLTAVIDHVDVCESEFLAAGRHTDAIDLGSVEIELAG